MEKDVEESFVLAEKALETLKSVGLKAEPRNYSVLFNYAAGVNPALAKEMRLSLRDDGICAQEDIDDIFDRHIRRSGVSQNVIALVEKFQVAVNQLAETVEETDESNTISTNELTVLSQDLMTAADEHPAIIGLVNSVVSAAKSVYKSNKSLESQLERSSQEVSQLKLSIEAVRKEALQDPLTGIHNRKSFDHRLLEYTAKSRKQNQPMALLFADVDHFKKFNDTWGHQTGDQVLRLVAEVMNKNIKGQDVLARYGGEEFAIILPNTGLDNAIMLADRIRKSIEVRRLKKRKTNADLGSITMSMGVATLQPGETPEMLLERADTLLYESKRNGRNCVTAEDLRKQTTAFIA